MLCTRGQKTKSCLGNEGISVDITKSARGSNPDSNWDKWLIYYSYASQGTCKCILPCALATVDANLPYVDEVQSTTTPHWGKSVIHFSGNKIFQKFSPFSPFRPSFIQNRQINKNRKVWISGKLYFCLAPLCSLNRESFLEVKNLRPGFGAIIPTWRLLFPLQIRQAHMLLQIYTIGWKILCSVTK